MTTKPAPNHPWRRMAFGVGEANRGRALHKKAEAHKRHEEIMADPIYHEAQLDQWRKARATWREKQHTSKAI